MTGQPAERIAGCVMPASARSAPAMRRFVVSTAGRWGIPVDAIDTLALVVTELVTNVHLHSGSPDVTVLLVVDGPTVTVEVSDFGRWVSRTAPRRVAEDAGASCGRGLDLVKRISSWWLAFLSPAGTRIVARVPVDGAVG
ncbi:MULTISPECIES: ATP-binding protein [Kitasatospora]|uniref:Anti-sigma regulatory factor (Ser/Thr protein kinase) n=2 Tax=Kitasatospora TaxID=2063 RepID=A0ABT1J2G3_9ACTN|nr:ATP-binding protein [Kitasatospora paracochleata]MCP2311434.1 anti-sigma regulatory factor (Ser/Thr protein kinase) [Kitasatospora paracochleata]